MKIMAIDYGEARTGLALCDRTEYLASPIGTIRERDFADCVTKIVYTAKEYDVEAIVVGHPVNMDGSHGEKAQKCERLANMLHNILGIPVDLWDERQTTMQAANYLNEMNVRGQKRKDVIDEVAATIILESYLAYRKNHKPE
jgi:putative Holliday junction resolvase